jgi:uncharacterized metal-binding protein YceD (DUF177 family)
VSNVLQASLPMTEEQSSQPSEFSRIVPVGRLTGKPVHHRIEADAAECAALAKRFELESVDRLVADVTLAREAGGGGVRLEAELTADIVQTCGVTLEPVPAHVTDRFALIFRAGIDEEEADRLALENPEEEIIEPLMADLIDIGEAVAQQLSVAMDPYPRAPSAQSTAEEAEVGQDADPTMARRNPFEALAVLKKQS